MSSVFTLIPRPLYEFKSLDLTSRYAFGLIYDRLKLSAKEENRSRFQDMHGTYCVYSRTEMAAEMGITEPTLRKAVKALTDQGLIKADVYKLGGSYRYYLRLKAKESLDMQDLPDYAFYEHTWTEDYNPVVDP